MRIVLVFLLLPVLTLAETGSSEHFSLQASAVVAAATAPAAPASSAGFHLEAASIGLVSGADVASPAYVLQPGYYMGMLSAGMLASVDVSITASEDMVTLSWEPLGGSCEVWSSDNPYSGFSLDESGSFLASGWTAPHAVQKRYYQVRCTF